MKMQQTSFIFLILIQTIKGSLNELRELSSKRQTFNAISESNIKIIGRKVLDVSKNLIYFDWSGSAIVFSVTGNCENVFIRLDGDGTRFNVYLNGNLENPITINSKGLTDFKIASGLTSKTEIKLVKINEAQFSFVYFQSVIFEGDSCVLNTPPKAKEYLIEFVGDSDTCAYGVESQRKILNSSIGENVEQGHAGYISKAFNADFSAICISGIGAVYDTSSENNKFCDFYQRPLYNDKNFLFKTETKPNLIVVYLGGNDYYTLKNSNWNNTILDDYVSKYSAFLSQIRNFNPSINNILPPILVLAPGKSTASATSSASEMDDQANKLQPLIKRAVIASGGEDKKIYFRIVNPLPSISYNDDSDWGGDEHWSINAQKKFAAGYLPCVEEVTGWKRSFEFVVSGSASQLFQNSTMTKISNNNDNFYISYCSVVLMIFLEFLF